MLPAKKLFFWIVLLNVADEYLTVFATTREISFFKNANPAQETNSADPSEVTNVTSTFVCGSQCLAAFPSCTSYLHNSSTGLCIQASGPTSLVPQLHSGLGDLYVSCDTENGFYMHRYGDAVACVAVFFNPRRNFTLASSHCVQLGGYLPIIKTWEKLQLVTLAMENQSFWVGLDDMVEEGVYVWRDDGQVAFRSNATYTAAQMAKLEMDGLWDHPREPNNFADNEDCIQVKYSNTHSAFRLNDYKCYSRSRYACEMKIRFT
ncbi:C-type lectin-related protein 4 [Plakobranchus ocellatus]|uniref:C-type lectin-related protein 4 n=1 Tax=Plakobranchus ocellatus TaxID=259542 RepID=A0AAV4CPQ3_9GAST|nr:C-type lectin-related protein 4 [Plakobranchus ocellatus]